MATTYEMKPTSLTKEARIALSKEQNDLLATLDLTEQDQKDANGGFRKTKKELKKKIKEIRESLQSGEHREKVSVDEVNDDAHLMVLIYKAGTKDLLDKRPMSDKEAEAAKKRLQPTLFKGGDGAPAETNGKAVTNGKAHANGKPSAKAAPKDDGIVDDNYTPDGASPNGKGKKGAAKSSKKKGARA